MHKLIISCSLHKCASVFMAQIHNQALYAQSELDYESVTKTSIVLQDLHINYPHC